MVVKETNLDYTDNFEKPLFEFSIAMTDQKHLAYINQNHSNNMTMSELKMQLKWN